MLNISTNPRYPLQPDLQRNSAASDSNASSPLVSQLHQLLPQLSAHGEQLLELNHQLPRTPAEHSSWLLKHRATSEQLGQQEENLQNLLAQHLSNAEQQQVGNALPSYQQILSSVLSLSSPPPVASNGPTNRLQIESLRIDGMMSNQVSFFSLLISVMLFGYNATGEYAKLMLIKQKDAQAVAATLTDLNKFMLELSNLSSDNKNNDTTLYGLFYHAFGVPTTDENYDADANAILSKYLYLFDGVTTEDGKTFDDITWAGDSDAGGADEDLLTDLFNAMFESINQQLYDNGVSSAGGLNPFTSQHSPTWTSEEMISFDDTFSQELKTAISACEDGTSQLTTINQNLQATVSQATESIKSLLEWLKQAIQGYGAVSNPR